MRQFFFVYCLGAFASFGEKKIKMECMSLSSLKVMLTYYDMMVISGGGQSTDIRGVGHGLEVHRRDPLAVVPRNGRGRHLHVDVQDDVVEVTWMDLECAAAEKRSAKEGRNKKNLQKKRQGGQKYRNNMDVQ